VAPKLLTPVYYSIPFSKPLIILFRVWSRSQLTLGEGRAHPGQVGSLSQGTCRGRQPFSPTFTPTGNSEPPVNRSCMSLDRRGERANSTKKNPSPSGCEVTLLATTPLCSPHFIMCLRMLYKRLGAFLLPLNVSQHGDGWAGSSKLTVLTRATVPTGFTWAGGAGATLSCQDLCCHAHVHKHELKERAAGPALSTNNREARMTTHTARGTLLSARHYFTTSFETILNFAALTSNVHLRGF